MPDKQKTNKKPKMSNNKINNDVSCRNKKSDIENKNDISDDNQRR